MNERTKYRVINVACLASLLCSIVRTTSLIEQRGELRLSGKWPFFIAEKSSTWVRPSPADQQHVWGSIRFGGVAESRRYYLKNFFLWPDGANVPYYIETWAGIRDAEGSLRGSAEVSPCIPNTDAVRGAFSGIV